MEHYIKALKEAMLVGQLHFSGPQFPHLFDKPETFIVFSKVFLILLLKKKKKRIKKVRQRIL